MPVSLLPRYLFGLFLGTLGGFAFWALDLPLPWMLGALCATMASSVAGLPLLGPDRARPVVVAVIGVMLGARFSPEVASQALSWLGTLTLLFFCLIAMGAVNVPFFRYFGGYDWRTSYFAGMPGGLAEMIELAEARGGQVRPVILAHSLRIVITIALIALWFRLVMGHDVGSGVDLAVPALSWREAGLLLAAAVFGSLMGKALRWPAPTFLGPMALSAALHLSGISESAPPALLINAAQVVLGTVLGCRFRGVPLASLRRAFVLSLGSTGLILAIALGFAALMQEVAGIDAMQALLALAPGGLSEMGLIALAIEADVAFVALHHVVRILMVLIAAPLIFRLFERGRPPKG